MKWSKGGKSYRTPSKPRTGKRVVFVTPYANAAKEEAEKHERKGFRVEIKQEKGQSFCI